MELPTECPNWVTDEPRFGSAEPNIHIFGPYREGYEDILLDVSDYLRSNGYRGAKIALEIPDHRTRKNITDNEQNWWESVHFMNWADAAIFLFLQPDDNRLNGAQKEGLNSSAFAEFAYWTSFFSEQKDGTLVIYEGEMSKRGSLISGLVDVGGFEDDCVDFDEIEEIKKKCVTTCVDWIQ
jgi:hypothetical protein